MSQLLNALQKSEAGKALIVASNEAMIIEAKARAERTEKIEKARVAKEIVRTRARLLDQIGRNFGRSNIRKYNKVACRMVTLEELDEAIAIVRNAKKSAEGFWQATDYLNDRRKVRDA